MSSVAHLGRGSLRVCRTTGISTGWLFPTSNRRSSKVLATTQVKPLHIHCNLGYQLSPYNSKVGIQCVPMRNFASSQRRQRQPKGGRQTNNNNKDVLANEALIARLIRDAGGVSADKVQIRLVIDEGPNQQATVKMTNLSDAVQLSLDRMVDLIGTSLTTEPPVIRLAELAKLQYKAGQAQKKQQQQAAANKKEQKSFRFKAGIDSHDLERKVAQLSGYLQKGSDCEYTVFTRARTLRQNPNAGIELVDKIQALIADYGVLKREPQTNETKSFYRVKLSPKK